MALIIPSGFAQVAVIHGLTGDSEPIVNTFGISVDSDDVVNATLANEIMDAWGDAFTTWVSNEYVLEQVVIYGPNGTGASEVTISTLPPITYTNAVGPLPQNSAALIRKRTDTAGRRGRGRMYVAGVQEASVDTVGTIAPALLAVMQTSATNFLTALQGIVGIGGMVILHRSEGAGVEPAPSPVLNLTVESKVATQRRRLRP